MGLIWYLHPSLGATIPTLSLPQALSEKLIALADQLLGHGPDEDCSLEKSERWVVMDPHSYIIESVSMHIMYV